MSGFFYLEAGNLGCLPCCLFLEQATRANPLEYGNLKSSLRSIGATRLELQEFLWMIPCLVSWRWRSWNRQAYSPSCPLAERNSVFDSTASFLPSYRKIPNPRNGLGGWYQSVGAVQRLPQLRYRSFRKARHDSAVRDGAYGIGGSGLVAVHTISNCPSA